MKVIKYPQLRYFLLFLFGICFLSIYAQNNKSASLWADYRHQKYINKYKIWWRNDASIRHNFDEQYSTLFIYKTNLAFNIVNNLEFSPGIDLRYNNISDYDNTLEIRTWQSVILNWPNIGRFLFEHRYQFEQRFYFYSKDFQKEEIDLRSRYKLLIRVSLNNKKIYDKTFFLGMSSEFFLSHDNDIEERFAETVRLAILFGYKLNDKWTYSLSLMSNRGKNDYENERIVNNYIVSFTITNTLGLNHNKKELD